MAAFYSFEGMKQTLDGLITDLGSNFKVGLYTANSGSGQNTTLAQLTLATFSGYAAVTPTWATGSVDGNNVYNRVGTTCTFTHNGGGTSNTIIGYCVYDAGGSKLQYHELFGAPIVMSASGNQITITPTIYQGAAATPL